MRVGLFYFVIYFKILNALSIRTALFAFITWKFSSHERFGSEYWGDYYNRIWTSGATPKNCDNISTPPYNLDEYDNYPPIGVLNDSILTVNASDSIVLTVDLPPLDGPRPACFIFYFSTPNDTTGFRATQIYINGQMNTTITLPGLSSHVVTIYPIDVVGPTINITLAPTPNSTLSTLISGMEVFTKYDLPVPPPGSPVYHAPPPSAAESELLNLMYAILSLALSLVFVF